MLCLTLTAVGLNRRFRGYRSVSLRRQRRLCHLPPLPRIVLSIIGLQFANESVFFSSPTKKPRPRPGLLNKVEKSRDDQ
jgi:hypothetical protein